MKKTHGLKGKPKSSRHRKAIGQGRKLPISQLDLDGQLIKEFPSAQDAASTIGCTPTAINYALKGYTKTAHGFKWRYKPVFNSRQANNCFDFTRNKLSYFDIIASKKDLLQLKVTTLERHVDIVLAYIRQVQPQLPTIPTNEVLSIALDKIRSYDFEKIFDSKRKVFSNACSSVGVSYLKSVFWNYWQSSYATRQSPAKAWLNDSTMRRVIRYRLGINRNRETFDLTLHQLVRGLAAQRYTISFFKPIVAGAIYKHFLGNKKNPVVIDPCAGFGGRMLGFKALYPNGTYVGIEPDANTFSNLKTLAENFSGVELYNCKLEDYDEDKQCDLTFTSIPYYNTEKYSDPVTYDSFEHWRDQFISSLLEFDNLLINLPSELDQKLNLPVKEVFLLKSNTSHFNKKQNDKKELIVRL